jgi:hypothetical protein
LDEKQKNQFFAKLAEIDFDDGGTVKSTLTRAQVGLIFSGKKRGGTSKKDGQGRSMNSSVTSRFWQK